MQSTFFPLFVYYREELQTYGAPSPTSSTIKQLFELYYTAAIQNFIT